MFFSTFETLGILLSNIEYDKVMFKENLKFYRKSAGLSQKELADRLGVSYKTISHWESGYTQPPIEILIKLKSLLDISYEDLLE